LQGINRFDCDSPHFNYLSQINQGSFTPNSEAMAKKKLLEFSAPNINNIRIGPTIDHEFKLKPSLMLTVNGCIKVRLDLQADKSPVVVKGPFFPRVVNPRYRIRGTNV
jgi:hypothetical protein